MTTDSDKEESQSAIEEDYEIWKQRILRQAHKALKQQT